MPRVTSPDDTVEELPAAIGPYRVEGVLGRGGMGVVYRAVGPDGPVAVKVLRGDTGRAAELRSRFEQEGRVRIDHPNVVRTLDAGADGDLLYIAFERLSGRSLAERLEADHRLEPREVLSLGRQLAEGLAAAHALGIVHRDLKPSNIFLCDDGTPKLVDFGIARVTDRDTRLTATGHLVGTAAYLSPEQARGEAHIDARCDVWALGVVLYEAISGRHPFDRGSMMATMLAILAEPPAPLASLRGDVPAELSRAVMRCLERSPDRRFSDGGELARALAAIDPDAPIGRAGSPATQLSEAVGSGSLKAGSILPGEQRVVAVLLADGVRDRRALARAIEASGGLVVPLGERALGLFGSAAWEGDEMDRAAHAALRARSAVEAIAVASGRASYSGTTGITGSVLEAAEEGCRARLGGVALDAATAGALTPRFEVRRRPGGGELLREHGTRGADTTTGKSLSPPSHGLTVGREAELAQLRRAVRTLDEDSGAVTLLVVGGPGVGKSHLRWEMAQILEREVDDPPLVLSARAEPLHRDAAFSLFRELLVARAWSGQESDGWPSLDAAAPIEERRGAVIALAREADLDPTFLAELLGIGAEMSEELTVARRDPRLMADRLRLALSDWLAALSDAGPVALLLDDLQWADEPSLDLLDELVSQLADAPLLVLGCARPELLDARPQMFQGALAARIEPRPLLASEVEELAGALVGRPIPDGLARRLADRTGGNPLFVEQIVRALDAEGRLDEAAAELPLPLTVEAAVQSRLDQLPGAEKELCKRAALVERPVTAEELESLDVYDARGLLSSLVRRGIVVARGRSRGLRRYRFRNPLVRDVAYGMLGPALCSELHGRFATILAERVLDHEEPDPEEVATHFERAGMDAAAAPWFVVAARAAHRRGDPSAVIHCAEKALALGVDATARFELHMARADAYEVLGLLEPQGEALDLANADASSELDRARVGIDRAVWHWRRGLPDDAVALASLAVLAARGAGDREALALALGRSAVIRIYSGALEEAEALLEEAEALAKSLGPAHAAHAASWRAQLATARGDHAERRRSYREAVERYEEVGDVRRAAGAELNLADAANRVGAYADAADALRAAIAKSARVGNVLWEGYATLNLGYALSMLGRRDDALEALEQAQRMGDAAGEKRLVLFARTYAARVRGDVAGALEVADDASRAQLPGLRALALAIAANAQREAGELAAADASSNEALSILDGLGSLEEDEAEIYLARALTLEATERFVEGQEVRARGRARLRAQAELISDPELRARFLDDVPAHRGLG
jgi:predicted ATPase/predicted Ser/Thr protein kinase